MNSMIWNGRHRLLLLSKLQKPIWRPPSASTRVVIEHGVEVLEELAKGGGLFSPSFPNSNGSLASLDKWEMTLAILGGSSIAGWSVK